MCEYVVSCALAAIIYAECSLQLLTVSTRITVIQLLMATNLCGPGSCYGPEKVVSITTCANIRLISHYSGIMQVCYLILAVWYNIWICFWQGTKLRMTSVPLATAATLYHRFFHHFTKDDFDPHVCIVWSVGARLFYSNLVRLCVDMVIILHVIIMLMND